MPHNTQWLNEHEKAHFNNELCQSSHSTKTNLMQNVDVEDNIACVFRWIQISIEIFVEFNKMR